MSKLLNQIQSLEEDFTKMECPPTVVQKMLIQLHGLGEKVEEDPWLSEIPPWEYDDSKDGVVTLHIRLDYVGYSPEQYYNFLAKYSKSLVISEETGKKASCKRHFHVYCVTKHEKTIRNKFSTLFPFNNGQKKRIEVARTDKLLSYVVKDGNVLYRDGIDDAVFDKAKEESYEKETLKPKKLSVYEQALAEFKNHDTYEWGKDDLLRFCIDYYARGTPFDINHIIKLYNVLGFQMKKNDFVDSHKIYLRTRFYEITKMDN